MTLCNALKQTALLSLVVTMLWGGIAPTTQALMLTGGVEETVELPPEKGIVGMDIDVPKQQGYPRVKQVFEHTPAAMAGLHNGDRIIKIDGKVAYGLTPHRVDVAISDKPGTSVTFTVERDNGTYKTIMLVVMPLSRTQGNTRTLYPQATAHVASHTDSTRGSLPYTE
jgi:predicted metalloprotease with PDZ domain